MSDKNRAYKLHDFTVLIVEDHKFIVDLLSPSLKEMGVGNIVVAADGEQAVEKIKMYNGAHSGSNSIDIIMTDWLMPEMNGPELIKWVRGHDSDKIKFLPIILCSAYTSREIIEKARDIGANEALVKPVSAEKIAKRLQYVIDQPRPYLKAGEFFGPDRRRRDDEDYKGSERRKTNAEEITQHHEKI